MQDPDLTDEPPAAPTKGSLAKRDHATLASLRCRMGLHTALPSNLWNDGHYFSACSRCQIPLIRTPQESWHPVPRHFRVVWRRRTDDDIVWPTHVI